MKKSGIRTYSELIKFDTFEKRFEYLKVNGKVGEDTFGFDRYLNQVFYRSKEWKHIRDQIIFRDNGCDLGVEGYDIYGKIIIHHINPIVIDDLRHNSEFLLDPEYLICTTLSTHNAIHYGDCNLISSSPIERKLNDTCPWKH